MQFTSKELPQTRFAMNRLEFGPTEPEREPLSAPPYEINRDSDGYNIFFNMYGIPAQDIKVHVDADQHTLFVFAEREKKEFTDQYAWLFSLPDDAALGALTTAYKKGVVQFHFPKYLGLKSRCG